MTILVILAAPTVAALLLLMPVGLRARYAAGAFSLTVTAGPVPVRRLPGERRRQDKIRGGRKRVSRRIPPAVLSRAALRCRKRAGKTIRRVRLDALRLHFIAGGGDPFRTAMAYARAGAAMEGIRGMIGERVGSVDLYAGADFSGGPTVLDGAVAVKARLGTLLAAAVCFGTALLREYFRYQRERE